MHQTFDPSDDGHNVLAGVLCQDDGTGICALCGVAMTPCDLCGGIGYHDDLCPDSDETIALAIVRSDLAAELDRERLYNLSDALLRCDAELLAAVRALGLSGRDSLTQQEFSDLRRMMHHTLVRVSKTRAEVGP